MQSLNPVRLYFLQYGSRAEDIALAKLMLESARKVMPDMRCFHQRDPQTTPLSEHHVPFNRGDMLFSEYRALHESEANYAPAIFTDVDVIFREDIRPLFERDFDVALTVRGETDPLSGIQKYVCGIAYSKCPEFWHDVRQVVDNQPGPLRQWWGNQIAVNQVAESGKYKILDLNEREYNRAPRDPFDLAGAKVLHYRGPRKQWLLDPKRYADPDKVRYGTI